MTESAPSGAPAPATGRLLSLDAFRGTVMLLLVTGSLGLRPDLLLGFWPQSSFFQAAAQQWTHASYEGCFLWDLIQPAFMFIVGVSVPFSYAKRRSRGESYPQMLRHAAYRSLALVLLGVLMRLAEHGIYFTFEDVIAQIGLGYVFVFLLWNRPRADRAGLCIRIPALEPAALAASRGGRRHSAGVLGVVALLAGDCQRVAS
ncbi:MAG: DUF5009 domain-containing protein [Planctomycetia bacterium]|nr:DUF5009 domain-containing protein [Planctomycetia bacterium]